MARRMKLATRIDRLTEGLDKQLIRLVEEGRPVHGKDGEVHYEPPTASDLRAVRERLFDLKQQGGQTIPNELAQALHAARQQAEDQGDEGDPHAPLKFAVE